MTRAIVGLLLLLLAVRHAWQLPVGGDPGAGARCASAETPSKDDVAARHEDKEGMICIDSRQFLTLDPHLQASLLQAISDPPAGLKAPYVIGSTLDKIDALPSRE